MKKLLCLIIVIIIITSYFILNKKNDEHEIVQEPTFEEKLKENISDQINIEKYYVYGNHFNIEGNLLEEMKDLEIKLIFKSENQEIEYPILMNELSFSTSNNINEGILLDTIIPDKYYLLIKTISEEETKYYGIKTTDMKENEYYTISNSKKTNKIEIKSDEYMYMEITNTKKPEDIYDIVIDPGHGGKDSGAIYNHKKEADFTLSYALSLKEKLEKYGYKIKLTRDKDVTLDSYGKNSRTAISYETKAKYMFSIHFNSNQSKLRKNGIEIYAPPHINLDFASSLANNIVNNLEIDYSSNTYYRVLNGVYVRTLNSSDINKMKEDAEKLGYTPYDISSDTPYLYMIRETGGFMTKAFNDGRDPKKNKNDYYDSNIAAEGYLLELSYLNDDNSLNFVLNNQEKYAEVLAETIHDYIQSNITKE